MSLLPSFGVLFYGEHLDLADMTLINSRILAEERGSEKATWLPKWPYLASRITRSWLYWQDGATSLHIESSVQEFVALAMLQGRIDLAKQHCPVFATRQD